MMMNDPGQKFAGIEFEELPEGRYMLRIADAGILDLPSGEIVVLWLCQVLIPTQYWQKHLLKCNLLQVPADWERAAREMATLGIPAEAILQGNATGQLRGRAFVGDNLYTPLSASGAKNDVRVLRHVPRFSGQTWEQLSKIKATGLGWMAKEHDDGTSTTA